MVMVESASPQQFTALPDYAGFYSLWGRVAPLLPSLARTGLARVTFGTGFAGLPAAARDQERAFTSTARDLSSQRVEYSQLPAAFRQAQALTTLDGKPLIVLTAREGQQAGWFAAQDALAKLSTNSVAPKCGRRYPRVAALRPGLLRQRQPGHPRRRRGAPRRCAPSALILYCRQAGREIRKGPGAEVPCRGRPEPAATRWRSRAGRPAGRRAGREWLPRGRR